MYAIFYLFSALWALLGFGDNHRINCSSSLNGIHYYQSHLGRI